MLVPTSRLRATEPQLYIAIILRFLCFVITMRVSTIHRLRKLDPIFELALKSEAVLLINKRAGRMVIMHYRHLTEIIDKEDYRNFYHQTND